MKGVSASIASGEFVCQLVPNCAGKTTLAQQIAGEQGPTTGWISLYRDTKSAEQELPGPQIAYLPQDLQDPPFVPVGELVSLGRFRPKRSLGWRLSETDKGAVQRYIVQCLSEALSNRPFAQFSGGEKQRAWLASCHAQEREFHLLDESCTRRTIPGESCSLPCSPPWPAKATGSS